MSELHLYFFNDEPLVEANNGCADVLLIILDVEDEANQAGTNTEVIVQKGESSVRH